MGWNNPPIPWSEFEKALSDSRRPQNVPVGADGGDSPGWSHKRGAYEAPADPGPEADPAVPAADRVPYAELHAH